MKNIKFNWRINHQIKAGQVRVIGDKGKQIGVLGLSDAINRAHEEGLDLVEIAPNANPPVVRIVDLGKFKYEQEKKLQKQKKSNKSNEVKEVRLSPFIAEHDFQNRLGKIQEFLDEKYKVRAVVKFTGRQMGSKDFGYKLLDRLLAHLGDSIVVDMEPKFLGRHLVIIISPTSKPRPKPEQQEQSL